MQNRKNIATRVDLVVTLLVAALIVISAMMLLVAYGRGENLGLWVWERHRNQFSWYSRPLFIIPACYYAYRRNFWLSVGFILLIGCSLFWFDAPQSVPDHVVRYLNWEQQFFFNNQSLYPLLVLVFGVTVFLVGLLYAFWQRNPWIGLLLINAGTLMKIAVSVLIGGDAGEAAVVPSVSSLVVINLVGYLIWRRLNR